MVNFQFKSLFPGMGISSILMLSACASSIHELGYQEESSEELALVSSHSASRHVTSSKSMSLDDVDLAGWLDNSSSLSTLKKTSPPDKRPKFESPAQPLINEPRYNALEALVNSKVGRSSKEIQSSRILGETGHIELLPKWPGVAPLKSDTLLRSIGSRLLQSNEHFRKYKVPATKLDQAMNLIRPLGEVTHEKISAEDLSLNMGGVERRLKQLHLMEAKYKEILASVSEEKKAEVLKYLETVIQDIQILKQQQALLKEKAKWATLTVNFNFIRRTPYHNIPNAIAWIDQVRPWGLYQSYQHEALELELVNGFVKVDVPHENSWNPKLWRATHGNGSSIRAWLNPDLPKADVKFWTEALTQRLKNRYEIVECQVMESSVTPWNWCEFRVDAQDQRWSYLALRGKSFEHEEDARVIQIDFPSEGIKQIYLQDWKNSVKKAMEE